MHSRLAAGVALILLAVSAVSAVAVPVGAPAAGPAGGPGVGGSGGCWRVHLDAAVVVFDLQGGLDGGGVVREDYIAVNVTRYTGVLGPVDVCYNVSLHAFTASRGEAERLASGLRGLYEYPAVVSWSSYEPPGGYARVPLLDAYWLIYREAVGVLEARGFNSSSFDDVIVLIGDLDGVSRVYYEVREYPYAPGGYLALEGVRGWGGLAPMTFYDLSTVQKPWPDYEVPFAGDAPPASWETEPPIWLLDDPEGYAWGLVRDHVVYHLIGGSTVVPATLKLQVVVAVVDFGDEARTREILAQVDPGVAEEWAEALAPWVDVEVTVKVVDAPGELVEAYESAGRGLDGYKAIDLSQAYSPLQSLAHNVAPPFDPEEPESTWPFLVLATPEPAYFTIDGRFNFTGFASDEFGATTYPGLGGRVYKSSLNAVIAHEAGHRLGEGHPFQFEDQTRWLMDLQGTVMSYYDPGRAALTGYYHYSATRLALLQAIQYYQLAREEGADPDVLEEAARLIMEYRGADALRLLLRELGYNVEVPSLPPPPPPPQTPPIPPQLQSILTTIALAALIVLAALAAARLARIV